MTLNRHFWLLRRNQIYHGEVYQKAHHQNFKEPQRSTNLMRISPRNNWTTINSLPGDCDFHSTRSHIKTTTPLSKCRYSINHNHFTKRTMFLRNGFLVPIIGLFVDASFIARSGTSDEQVTYILPIWEGSLASHGETQDLAVLADMKSQLGLGGSSTKLGWSFSSWALSRDIHDSSQDFTFDPTNLNYMLNLGVNSSLPILVHMNNGRWADCCTPNSAGGWGDTLLDHIAAEPNTTVQNASGGSDFSHNGGNNFFTLSRLNTVYRQYKKRNVQASAQVIAQWGAANPSLFVGVSLDSETLMPNNEADYNPFFISEWKQWLQNTGMYGLTGEYNGAGRVPAFTDISSFNNATNQAFDSWDAMEPPKSITPGDPFSEEWERWRITAVMNAVSDITLWIATAGIPRNQIYGHQTSRADDYGFADDVMTETAANGASGVTMYGWGADSVGSLTPAMRGSGKNNWGVFEHNPLSNDSSFSYDSLKALVDDGIKIICPNSWESDEATKDQYALFDSPNFGDTYGATLNKFLSDYGNTPRNLQPPPWNPGTKVFDFYDSFPNATQTGQDNHQEASGSVGNVVRKSVYSAVGGSINYTVSLPVVTGNQRLNFWTSLGIKDGAGIGGEAQFQVQVNGQNLFGQYFHTEQNYWVWKRWVPMMVDVTAWAGQTITFDLLTTGNQEWGWTTWGAPAVYVTDDNNLALRKSVNVSSTDGAASGWGAATLTDGNFDGTDGRLGWSSVSHPSPSAVEWVSIDFGSSQSYGKVVLFPRSDLVEAEGTGFPTDFIIQTSDDSTNWKTIVTLASYPRVKAGDAQILSFEQVQGRYVRIYATGLGGVCGESGYRFQLTAIAVYA
ncbi:hypothetical protein G7Y89_g6374 [Cudoniella acicularis]|uniref:F5/8 type C domain-containing protein n=1 Tax=Cudoniella acicularis TaxID=354080 RepID=A0A8H4RM26_9HELO|nr:hypothetical protein G7Y89_g6374 [Cudoniella acicularis]